MRIAGYYYDADTENYYLKNRYYDSSDARFLTEDPYWNVNNMLYGNATDSVIRNVYYPAVVQSGNRFAIVIIIPLIQHSIYEKTTAQPMTIVTEAVLSYSTLNLPTFANLFRQLHQTP